MGYRGGRIQFNRAFQLRLGFGIAKQSEVLRAQIIEDVSVIGIQNRGFLQLRRSSGIVARVGELSSVLDEFARCLWDGMPQALHRDRSARRGPRLRERWLLEPLDGSAALGVA